MEELGRPDADKLLVLLTWGPEVISGQRNLSKQNYNTSHSVT